MKFGKSKTKLDKVAEGKSQTYTADDFCSLEGKFIDPGFIHDVLLTGLEPSKVYYYSCGVSGVRVGRITQRLFMLPTYIVPTYLYPSASPNYLSTHLFSCTPTSHIYLYPSTHFTYPPISPNYPPILLPNYLQIYPTYLLIFPPTNPATYQPNNPSTIYNAYLRKTSTKIYSSNFYFST